MLKHKDKLLSDIAHGLRELASKRDPRVNNVKVDLKDRDGVKLMEYFGLAEALVSITDDVYWDEQRDWSDAYSAKVDTY